MMPEPGENEAGETDLGEGGRRIDSVEGETTPATKPFPVWFLDNETGRRLKRLEGRGNEISKRTFLSHKPKRRIEAEDVLDQSLNFVPLRFPTLLQPSHQRSYAHLGPHAPRAAELARETFPRQPVRASRKPPFLLLRIRRGRLSNVRAHVGPGEPRNLRCRRR
jgi:hypothetical protein